MIPPSCEHLTPCGTYCPSCLAFTGELSLQAEGFLSRIRRQGFLERAAQLNPEERPAIESFFDVLDRLARSPRCPGCAHGGGETECPVRRCCLGKGFLHCGECPELEACLQGKGPVGSESGPTGVIADARKVRGQGKSMGDPSAFFRTVSLKYQDWNVDNLKRAREEGEEAVIQELKRDPGFRTDQVKREDPALEAGRF